MFYFNVIFMSRGDLEFSRFDFKLPLFRKVMLCCGTAIRKVYVMVCVASLSERELC